MFERLQRHSLSFFILTSFTLACSDSSFSGSSGSKSENRRPSTASEVKESQVTLPAGETTNVKDLPEAGAGKIQKMQSLDPKIATVDEEGNIKAVAVGTTQIVVVYDNGSKLTINVTVVAPITNNPNNNAIDIDTGDPGSGIPSFGDNGGMEQALSSDTGDTPLLVFKAGIKGGIVVKPLSPDAITTVWAATRPGNAYWFRLDGDKVVETRQWTGLTSSDSAKGSRTYVTEKGAVIARTGGHLYWIDPEATPQGALPQALPNYYKLPNVAAEDRVCIVSYRKDKKRYVGMGWGMGNFIEFPMDDAPPHKPQWGMNSVQVTVPGVRWGYSCFIDQARLIYYSQWAMGSQGVGAVDLKTMQPVDPALAPNAKFKSTNVAEATLGSGPKGSYVMNGDLAGNVYNGTDFYTLAHERVSRTVWGMTRVDSTLRIYPDKCLTREANCLGHAAFPMAEFNGLMPLSALPDGRMIAMMRGTNGRVYLLKLKDKKDLTKGVDAMPIADLVGDPYMYTDFTGATLYLTKSDTTFELDASTGFDTTKPATAVGFTWLSRSSTDVVWSNIKFEIRCYASTGNKGDFEAVDTIKDALKQTVITTPSCAGKNYDRIDVRLTQLADDDTLMNIGRVQITAYQ